MKKFLTLIGAALIGLSASAADWFISGQFQGWDHCAAAYQFTETSSGVFSVNINKSNFAGEFVIVQGTVGTPDWNNKIGGATNMVADTEYTYTPGGNNFSVSGVINCSKIEFNTNTQKIKIYGVAGENSYDTVYLVGDINGSGWKEDLTTYPLSSTDGKTWKGEYSITNATSYFKMKAGNFIYGTGGEDIQVAMGTPYTASQSGNAFAIGAGKYTFTYVLEKNAATGTLTVTSADGGSDTPVTPTPGTDYSSWWVNFNGDFTDWMDNGAQPNAEGIAAKESLAIGTGEFEVKIWNGSTDAYYGTGSAIAVGEWVQLYEGGGHMTVAGATASSVYNAEYNCATNQIKLNLVSGGSDTPIAPNPGDLTFYIAGANNDWTAGDAAYKMNHEAGTNVYTITASNIFGGEWKITNSDWSCNFGMGDNLEAGVENECWFGGQNFRAISDGEVTLTFTLVAGSDVEGSSVPSLVKYTTAGGSDTPVTPNPGTDYSSWWVNFYGDFTDWMDNGVQPNAEGLAAMESLAIGTGEFEVKIWNGNDIYYGTGSAIAVGEWVQLYEGGGHMTVAGATASSVYNAEFNCATNQIKLTLAGGGSDTPVTPTPGDLTLYIAGAFNDWNAGDPTYKMDHEAGTNVYTITASNIFGGEWKITNSDWSWSFGMGDSFVEGVENECWFDGQNFSAISEGEVTVVFTLVAGSDVKDSGIASYVKYATDGSLGVSGVELNGQAVEYFNLQGVRVANPANGVYIMRQGNNVSKVYVK